MTVQEHSKISRRGVLAGVPSAVLYGLVNRSVCASSETRPRIAAIVTEFRNLCHAQCIVDRFLEGYGWETQHHRPPIDVVSMYVDQFPESDLSRERADRVKNLKIYPTIAEALTLGGEKLAVDGVLLIGEHGRYPKNERGQTLYPRYEFFRETVKVFRDSGRTVPVFTDKHLSWKWDWAKEMVNTAHSLQFPLMAGSSLPVTWRIPSVDLPWEADVTETVSVGTGEMDSYDIHALEAMQCLVERRRGGETGVARLQAFRDDALWELLRAGSWEEGGCDMELFEACLCRSHRLGTPRPGFNHVYPTLDEIRELTRKSEPIAYRFEYLDGSRATMLLLPGAVRDMTVAVRVKDRPEPISTQFYLGAGHHMHPNFFNPLVNHIETLILEGRTPYPVERTLLTTGLTVAGVESLWRNGVPLETPHLAIQYRPRPHSTFRRT